MFSLRRAEGGDFGESGCFGNLPTLSPRGGSGRKAWGREKSPRRATRSRERTETLLSATAGHTALGSSSVLGSGTNVPSTWHAVGLGHANYKDKERLTDLSKIGRLAAMYLRASRSAPNHV